MKNPPMAARACCLGVLLTMHARTQILCHRIQAAAIATRIWAQPRVSAVEVSHDLFQSGLCKSAACIQYLYYHEDTPISPLYYVAGTKQADGLGSICFRVKISSDSSAASR